MHIFKRRAMIRLRLTTWHHTPHKNQVGVYPRNRGTYLKYPPDGVFRHEGEGILKERVISIAKLSKKQQDEFIQQEINRLNEILRNINSEKRAMAQPLIENIAFMAVTLNELKEIIKIKGPITLMEQGTQRLLIESPAQKSYNSMIKNFNASMKQLFDLLPKDPVDIIPQDDKKSKPEHEKDALEKYQEKYNK